jgi:predicted double-glycine peptidase
MQQQGISLPRNLIRVPTVRQSTNYTCGVAALMSVLQYWGVEYREDALKEELGAKFCNPDLGTNHLRILEFAKEQGFEAIKHLNLGLDNLKKMIDLGKPVMIALQAWAEDPQTVNWKEDYEDGHYVVVIGYDDQNVFFMDPSTLGNYVYVPTQEFLDRWHDEDGDEGKTKVIQLGLEIYKATPPTYNPNVALKMD